MVSTNSSNVERERERERERHRYRRSPLKVKTSLSPYIYIYIPYSKKAGAIKGSVNWSHSFSHTSLILTPPYKAHTKSNPLGKWYHCHTFVFPFFHPHVACFFHICQENWNRKFWFGLGFSYYWGELLFGDKSFGEGLNFFFLVGSDLGLDGFLNVFIYVGFDSWR